MPKTKKIPPFKLKGDNIEMKITLTPRGQIAADILLDYFARDTWDASHSDAISRVIILEARKIHPFDDCAMCATLYE